MACRLHWLLGAAAAALLLAAGGAARRTVHIVFSNHLVRPGSGVGQQPAKKSVQDWRQGVFAPCCRTSGSTASRQSWVPTTMSSTATSTLTSRRRSAPRLRAVCWVLGPARTALALTSSRARMCAD